MALRYRDYEAPKRRVGGLSASTTPSPSCITPRILLDLRIHSLEVLESRGFFLEMCTEYAAVPVLPEEVRGARGGIRSSPLLLICAERKAGFHMFWEKRDNKGILAMPAHLAPPGGIGEAYRFEYLWEIFKRCIGDG